MTRTSTDISTCDRPSTSRSSRVCSESSWTGKSTSSPKNPKPSPFLPAPGQSAIAAFAPAFSHSSVSQRGGVDAEARRHRFWAHAAGTEDLVFKCWVHPQDLDHSFDESFLRNFVGYMRDCQQAKMAPSPFQLALFGYDSATVACPPFWVPLWFLVAIHYVLAHWIAAGLLG